VTRTNALESLVIFGWVRGLLDRDIEAALAEVLGSAAALLKVTVLLSCQRIRAEFDARKRRDRAPEVGDRAYRRHFTPDIISRPRR
jgi:putative transposase